MAKPSEKQGQCTRQKDMKLLLVTIPPPPLSQKRYELDQVKLFKSQARIFGNQDKGKQ